MNRVLLPYELEQRDWPAHVSRELVAIAGVFRADAGGDCAVTRYAGRSDTVITVWFDCSCGLTGSRQVLDTNVGEGFTVFWDVVAATNTAASGHIGTAHHRTTQEGTP